MIHNSTKKLKKLGGENFSTKKIAKFSGEHFENSFKNKKIANYSKSSDEQLLEDIKRYIKSSHSFYETRVPELKVLANRLHEEYSLNKFYKVFDRLWNSGISKEASLAIYTLQLYKDRFNMKTWRFIKKKLLEIHSWDKIDSIAVNIVGEILVNNPALEKEMIRFLKGKNPWFKRMAVLSAVPLIRKNDFKLAIKIIDEYLYNKNEYIQKAVGMLLNEIGKHKPELLKRILAKNVNMPINVFFHATEHRRELRKLKELSLDKRFERLFFWKNNF